MSVQYVAAGFARLRGGDIRARVGADPFAALNAQMSLLNTDVSDEVVAGDPSAIAFAADWAVFQAKPPSSLAVEVPQYEAFLTRWKALGFATMAKHVNADGSMAFFSNLNVSGVEAAAGAVGVAATIYLAYDVWESRHRR